VAANPHPGGVPWTILIPHTAIFFNIPSDWDDFDLSHLRTGGGREPVSWANLPNLRNRAILDAASARLADGTLVQVGRSSEARDELLGHFRSRVAASSSSF
jgi:hypothetical protein